MGGMSKAYEAAGVNLELGDELSKMLYEASKQTWVNREGKFGEPTADLDSFSGLRSMSIAPLLEIPDPANIVTIMGDDGIGTKVEVAERMGDHATMAFDLLAMICDDAAVKGFEPVAVTTTLDVQRLDKSMRDQMQDLARGYVLAAKAARVALVNGEVAELGDLVGGYGEGLKYNWNATYLAAGHNSRLLDGNAVSAGDQLVGFQEMGFRSNGLSLVRKTLKAEHGPEWHRAVFTTPIQFGEYVLRPSVIYTPILVDAIGGYDLSNEAQARVSAAAHITGGGIPGKLGRMLQASGLGADIENPFSPSAMMQYVQEKAGIADSEAYTVWNMGQGMIVATPEPAKVIELARNHGVRARAIGEVVKQPGITIRSRGVKNNGTTLRYEA